MTEEQLAFIREQFEALAEIKYQTLAQITFEDIDFNPILLRLLDLKTAEEIAEFVVSQRLERSMFTTFGHRIQKIAANFATRLSSRNYTEVIKEKNGVQHYIQIRSGPEINKGGAKALNAHVDSGANAAGAPTAHLGLIHGKKVRLKGSVLDRYSNVDWLVGREFWQFIADDPDCARKIFEIACDVTENYAPQGNPLSYRQLKYPKVKEISDAIKKCYGEDPDEMWRNLFLDNI